MHFHSKSAKSACKDITGGQQHQKRLIPLRVSLLRLLELIKIMSVPQFRIILANKRPLPGNGCNCKNLWRPMAPSRDVEEGITVDAIA